MRLFTKSLEQNTIRNGSPLAFMHDLGVVSLAPEDFTSRSKTKPIDITKQAFWLFSGAHSPQLAMRCGTNRRAISASKRVCSRVHAFPRRRLREREE
jgi:hypothetical protein